MSNTQTNSKITIAYQAGYLNAWDILEDHQPTSDKGYINTWSESLMCGVGREGVCEIIGLATISDNDLHTWLCEYDRGGNKAMSEWMTEIATNPT
jgi:hypothetical protein